MVPTAADQCPRTSKAQSYKHQLWLASEGLGWENRLAGPDQAVFRCFVAWCSPGGITEERPKGATPNSLLGMLSLYTTSGFKTVVLVGHSSTLEEKPPWVCWDTFKM